MSYQLSAKNFRHSLFTVYCSLFTVHQLSAKNFRCLPFTFYFLLFTFYFLLFPQNPTLAEVTIETTPENPSQVAIDPPPSRPSWQDSPVLQRWQQRVPNVLEEIENDPSFRTRWRLGYGEENQQGGVNLGVEDVFLGDRFTLSGDYQSGNSSTYGTELRYYLLPLGNYLNAAPIVGYRQVNTGGITTKGATVGGRLQVVLSRPSAADLALSQTWVAPGSSQEVAITSLAVGYAITRNVRLGTQWQLESRGGQSDRRLGIFVEFY